MAVFNTGTQHVGNDAGHLHSKSNAWQANTERTHVKCRLIDFEGLLIHQAFTQWPCHTGPVLCVSAASCVTHVEQLLPAVFICQVCVWVISPL